MRTGRRLISIVLGLAYGLVATCCDVAHQHSPRDEQDVNCQAACNDDTLHISGHASHDLSKPHLPCEVCLLRAQPLAKSEPFAYRLPQRVDSVAVRQANRVASVERPRASVRAPPFDQA